MNNIIGKEVYHKTFGTGIVKSIKAGLISVQFSCGIKKFSYPTGLDFLTFKETDELHITKLKPKSFKIERFNIAFKCNYCDGGASQQRIGYNGICSDEVINYNIETAHHSWCSNESCNCRRYLDGKISRRDLIADMKNGGFICYESTMLRDWKASAGVSNGRPMKLLKAQANSLAILTTRDPCDLEDKRFIFAVFLVDEIFEGDAKEAGYVKSNSKWRIELTPHEAHQMLFWNYYVNPNNPQSIAFRTGLHRYISDIQAVHILKDIFTIKEQQNEKEFAKVFLQHYCTINGIDADNLPPPEGALRRNKNAR